MPNTIKTMIDPADAVMLLIDHQSGLFHLVEDIDMLRLRHNVSALAKVSRLAKLPTFTTASVPDGPIEPWRRPTRPGRPCCRSPGLARRARTEQ